MTSFQQERIMEKKYIICINRGGLCNRLKGLISAMRLSKKLGRILLLYWPNNQYCGCNFGNLFENNFSGISESSLKDLKTLKDYKIYNDVLVNFDNKEKYLLLKTWKFVLLPNEIHKNFAKIFPSKKGTNIDFEYERIPDDLKKELFVFIDQLKPKESLKLIVDRFTDAHKLEECIGVHIRRGDNRFSVDGREKVSPDDLFIKRMKEILKVDPLSKFLLCTDGEETEKKFKEIFKDRIIVYPKGSRKRSGSLALQEALMDLLLLSKTKHIIGSYLSTFTELAWWFGGCKSKIEILSDESKIKDISKLRRKINFYKVNLLRRIYRIYK